MNGDKAKDVQESVRTSHEIKEAIVDDPLNGEVKRKRISE
jgi:hypothetical protein